VSFILRDARKSALLRMRGEMREVLILRRRESAVSKDGGKLDLMD
jgi:hypothetical protein